MHRQDTGLSSGWTESKAATAPRKQRHEGKWSEMGQDAASINESLSLTKISVDFPPFECHLANSPAKPCLSHGHFFSS